MHRKQLKGSSFFRKRSSFFSLAVLSFILLASPLFASGSEESGEIPQLWSVIPFVIMLLSIAVLPVTLEHWWHSNTNKLIVALALGIPVALYMVTLGRFHDVVHQMILDYIPFIALLGALYYISGGIVLRGDIEATPLNNSIFLAVGGVLASFIGTTGASMLLIRPLIKSNSERKHVVHTIVFFIFIVSNIGGLLTPLGDPPLFLGYLKGVPFQWTFRLAPQWLTMILALLVIYFIWDTVAHGKETKRDILRDESQITPISMHGHINFVWLLGVVLVVAFVNENYDPFRSLIHQSHYFKLLQVPLFISLMLLSKISTPEKFRKENAFTLYPIQEVAYLFIGIFLTMIPALILLREYGHSLGVTEAWQFFLATGIFSSFLDNAPTYLVFLALGQGHETVQHVVQFMPHILAAISMGAVFMGANTYIGNAPNFMVKSIAEENRVKMPNFGAYMLYSIGILGPLYVLIIVMYLR